MMRHYCAALLLMLSVAFASLQGEVLVNPNIDNKELFSFLTSPQLESHSMIELSVSANVEGAFFHVAEKSGTIVGKHDISRLTPSEFQKLIGEQGFVAGEAGSAKRAKVRANPSEE